MSGQHEVIGFLSRADSYGCPGGTVERIETHGSLIFLCGERVYKLKREIAYASLDFLTLEKRERACHAELRLNRRTAPGLYLRVSAITRDRAGVLAFDADGEVLDWVVVMRRFPQSTLFDRMALAGELTPSLMQTLGVEVARLPSERRPLVAALAYADPSRPIIRSCAASAHCSMETRCRRSTGTSWPCSISCRQSWTGGAAMDACGAAMAICDWRTSACSKGGLPCSTASSSATRLPVSMSCMTSPSC